MYNCTFSVFVRKGEFRNLLCYHLSKIPPLGSCPAQVVEHMTLDLRVMRLLKKKNWGAWVTQSVKCPALRHFWLRLVRLASLDRFWLRLCSWFREFEPCVRLCTDIVEPAWEALSFFLSALPLLMLSLSLYQKKKLNKNIFKNLVSKGFKLAIKERHFKEKL